LLEIKEICRVRANNDPRYAAWIAAGKAWWLKIYQNSDDTVFGQGWEKNLNEHPLPRWWWRYPEIPCPSDEWFAGADYNILTGRRIERRLTHMPPAQFGIKAWLKRVYLSNPTSTSDITKQGAGMLEFMPLSERMDNILFCNNPIQTELFILEFVRPIEILPNQGNGQPVAIPSATARTIPIASNPNSITGFGQQNPLFENFTQEQTNSGSNVWTIIWVVIIVIICILVFIYFNSKK